MRSPFRWFGGKGRHAERILSFLPSGRVYVEPFCGAASLFWQKEPHPVEVLNDLHSEIVNLFRVLQDPEKVKELEYRIHWTLYSREEFVKALRMEDQEGISDIDRAWAFYVRQNQGFGGKADSDGNWGRVFTGREMAENTSNWITRKALFDAWNARLMRVQIDHCDALKCIRYWDSADTVFYLDPPYLESTRKGSGEYKHEVTDQFHEELVDLLLNIQGNAILSGYDDGSYDRLTDAGWQKESFETTCSAAGRTRSSGLQVAGSVSEAQKRTEVLWIKGASRQKRIFQGF